MRTVLVILLLSTAAFADDTVVLKNGDKLSGKIVGMGGGKLTIETAHSGKVTVDWAQVASIKSDGKVKVRLSTGEMLEGTLDAGEAGRLKIATEGPSAPVEVELGKVTHFNEPPVAWHGGIDLAARATDGNTHTKSFLLSAQGVRESEGDRITIKALWKYSENDGVLSERNAYGLGKYDYKFSEKLYAYASVELFTDIFKDLRLRTVVSAGAGYTFVKSDDWDFSAEAGIAWLDNDFRVSKDESHLGARLATHLRVKLPLGFNFTDDLTYYPNFDESDDWQIHNEAAVSTDLGGGWTFKAGWILDFDNDPPVGAEEHDDTYFIGLGYHF